VSIPNAELTISAVAARTGVTVPTLRAWEARYGFPKPQRLPGGHRRYTDDDIAAIERVRAERDSGRSLDAAVALVSAETIDDETIFAALRRRRPALQVQVLSRRGMLALSRAMETEASAHGERAHLVAAFQRASVYRNARQVRWAELARAASSVIVFADFRQSRHTAAGVHEIALPVGAPQEREWAVIVDGRRFGAVLAGWERPDGRFEAVWTVEHAATRIATIAARALAAGRAHELRLPPLFPLARASDELVIPQAMSVAARAVAHLDRLGQPRTPRRRRT
jgi:DNA-binding transcriptional MerR regulator